MVWKSVQRSRSSANVPEKDLVLNSFDPYSKIKLLSTIMTILRNLSALMF